MVLLYIGLWLVQKFSPLSRPITIWSPALSRALGSSLAFTLRSHSFYKLFSFLLIGCWNFFWFWFCVTQSKIAQSQNIEINWQVQVSRELRQIKKTIKTLLSYSTELKCVDINRCVFFSCFSCHFWIYRSDSCIGWLTITWRGILWTEFTRILIHSKAAESHNL